MQESNNLSLTETAGFDAALTRAIERVMAPISEATGIPNPFYTDAAFHEAEYQRVFALGWACIGVGADVPEPGDALPVTFFGRPLVILRDRTGQVRVFHNVCSHRGMMLVPEPASRLRVLRCPYHHWCYGMDGSLQATPNIGGAGEHEHADFDKSKAGLREVRTGIWFNLVFVNMSGDGAPFEDYIGPLAERWSDFKDVKLVHGGADSKASLEINANWKLAIENFCESYHLPSIHPALNSYSRLEDHFNIDVPGHFSGQGSLVYNPVLAADGRSLPSHRGISEQWETGAEYASFFPNMMLGIHKDHFYVVRLDPVAVDRTVEHLDIYYFDDGQVRDDSDLRRENLKIWTTVFQEDVMVVEGMQKGRASPGFEGGAFSPVMDGPTHTFHRWIAERLAGNRPRVSQAAE